MTIPTPRLGPYRGTTPILNNLTPFTYRDGYTFLELIEELRDYVSEKVVGEINTLIKELNGANEGLAEKFNQLAADTKVELDRIVAIYEVKFQGVDGKVDAAVDRFNGVYEAYKAKVDAELSNMETKNTAHRKTIADLTDLWREMVGPPTTTFKRLTKQVDTLHVNENFSAMHPREFLVEQDDVGNKTAVFESNQVKFSGNPNLRKDPYSITRVRLLPSGYGSYHIDPTVQAVENSLFYKNGSMAAIASNRYSAFPSAARLSNSIICAWSEYSDHVGTNNGQSRLVRFARSVDNGESWSPIPSPTLSSDGKPGVLALCTDVNDSSRCYGLFMVDNPIRSFIGMYNDGNKTWTPLDGVTWGKRSWEYPSDIYQTREGSSTLTLIVSYGGDGVKVSRKLGYPLGGQWEPAVTVAEGSPTSWPFSESSIVENDAGHLIMSIRYEKDGEHAVYISRSTDKGRTWTRPRRAINNVGGHPKITRLSNGMYVMALRNHSPNYPDESWCYAISSDAYTWRVIPMNGGLWCMYGEFVEGGDGSLILVGSSQIRQNANRANVWAMKMELRISDQPAYDSGWYPLRKWRGPDAFTQVECRRVGDIVTFRGEITLGRNNSEYGSSDNIVAEVPSFARPTMRAAMSIPISGNAEGKATQFWVGADGRITLWPVDAPSSKNQTINLGGMSFAIGHSEN